MNATDAMNVWVTDLIYQDSNGVEKRRSRLRSGDVHLWLRKFGLKIKYNYVKMGWVINRILLGIEIVELEKIKSR